MRFRRKRATPRRDEGRLRPLAIGLVLSAVNWLIIFPWANRSNVGNGYLVATALISAAWIAFLAATAVAAINDVSAAYLVLAAVVLLSQYNATFSLLYYRIGSGHNFNQALSHTDAIYFNFTVFTTTGFGDIQPISQLARSVVAVHMVLNLVVLVFFIGAVVARVSATKD